MDLEIITYGNSAWIYQLFVTIDLILGENSYKQAMTIAVTLGFFGVLVAGALDPRRFEGHKWFISVALVYLLIVVPTARVQIVDRLNLHPPKVLANSAPLSLALVASLSSRIGDYLAQAYETNMSFDPDLKDTLESQLGYRGNGMMFGHRLLRESAKISWPDTYFRYDMVQFLANCVNHDVARGWIDAHKLNNAADLWDLLFGGGWYEANPALTTPHYVNKGLGDVPDSYVTELISCRKMQVLLAGKMSTMTDQAATVLGRTVYASMYDEEGKLPLPGVLKAQVMDDLMAAHTRYKLANGVADGAALVRQNAMINSINEAADLVHARTGDPTAINLNSAKAAATTQQNAAWLNGAKLAEETLPLLRNAIEVVLYAIFPAIVLMVLLTWGRGAATLLKNYATGILWLQLWTPLYAILNHMAIAATRGHISARGALPAPGEGALTLWNSASIYEGTVSDLAVVGYLVTCIPILAWTLIKGLDSITAKAMAGSNVVEANASAQAAKLGDTSGDVSMGHVDIAPSWKSGFSTREDGQYVIAHNDDGSFAHGQLKQSDMGATGQLDTRREAQNRAMAAVEVAQGQKELAEAREGKRAAFNDALEFAREQGWVTKSGGRTVVTLPGSYQHGKGGGWVTDDGTAHRDSAGTEYKKQDKDSDYSSNQQGTSSDQYTDEGAIDTNRWVLKRIDKDHVEVTDGKSNTFLGTFGIGADGRIEAFTGAEERATARAELRATSELGGEGADGDPDNTSPQDEKATSQAGAQREKNGGGGGGSTANDLVNAVGNAAGVPAAIAAGIVNQVSEVTGWKGVLGGKLTGDGSKSWSWYDSSENVARTGEGYAHEVQTAKAGGKRTSERGDSVQGNRFDIEEMRGEFERREDGRNYDEVYRDSDITNFIDGVMKTREFERAKSNSDGLARRIESGMEEYRESAKSAQAHFEKAERYTLESSVVDEKSGSASVTLNNFLAHRLYEEGRLDEWGQQASRNPAAMDAWAAQQLHGTLGGLEGSPIQRPAGQASVHERTQEMADGPVAGERERALRGAYEHGADRLDAISDPQAWQETRRAEVAAAAAAVNPRLKTPAIPSDAKQAAPDRLQELNSPAPKASPTPSAAPGQQAPAD
ncbi:MAG: conjugal transfer protein TraG N-terminal domain-containing protein, partial [Burkholderiaceae bacterium]|nr:conjugal transfer protein TraG N-terminal domain-containing protein [Burkholderiaceae bacterium]